MKLVKKCSFQVMIFALAGCATTSPRGGGMADEEAFRVIVPGGDTVIKQGEVEVVTISLNRGDLFKRDVNISVSPSAGIAVEPRSATIRASATPELQFRISAPRDAALGDYRVHVTATPEAGQGTSVDFNVKVVAP